MEIEDQPVISNDNNNDSSDELLNPNFPEFELEELLIKSPEGNWVLNYYKKNRRLNNENQNRLTDVIIKHIYTYLLNKYKFDKPYKLSYIITLYYITLFQLYELR